MEVWGKKISVLGDWGNIRYNYGTEVNSWVKFGDYTLGDKYTDATTSQ